MTENIAICPECGHKFKKKNWQHKFCSHECNYKHNYVSQAVHEERKCLNCGKSFVSSNSRAQFCGRKCSKIYYNREKNNHHSEWIRRGNTRGSEVGYFNKVQTKYSQFEYAGGWENDNAYFVCKDCGCLFKHGTKNLRPSETKRMTCPVCSMVLAEVRKQEREQERKEEQERARKIRTEKIVCTGIQMSLKICDACGSLFVPLNKRQKCCSNKCSNSLRYKVKDAYRYIIPLEELAERDNDTCQICGGKVDWNDYKTNENGYVIYGNYYPSRDHIIPKSKGGNHTWQNIQLAHRICNTHRWAQELTKTS